MKSKTAQQTVVRSASTGRYTIDPKRDNAPVTQGMREAAQAIARAVMKENATTKTLKHT
ncbi:hypothetical protein ACFP9V_19235 [Deinococcus radiopugnans]|uniref:DUF2188 domain-containing protein n=1 Tax=Deinococcus radiopugnans ATCC 19172 TaxID=585398 RepID=A0ABR6NRU5_9DEIO|nr:hypothetical protein [Deinococcus radiopugnans]MBB6016762.1 hypothetical protein [Deinococcus radiopugnans ATCC 19172]